MGEAVQETIDYLKTMAGAATRIAGGDLTGTVEPKSSATRWATPSAR